MLSDLEEKYQDLIANGKNEKEAYQEVIGGIGDVDELLEELKKYDSKDIYIVGGESVYRQMLPYCDTAHLTKIDRTYEADRYFPDLDGDGGWEVTAESEEQTYFDIAYEFVEYRRSSIDF